MIIAMKVFDGHKSEAEIVTGCCQCCAYTK